jgi:hypothetical protein
MVTENPPGMDDRRVRIGTFLPKDSEGNRVSVEPEDSESPESAPPDREGSKWGGYALALLLVLVFLIGLLRLVYPRATGLLVGAVLALFGVFVALLAVRERL